MTAIDETRALERLVDDIRDYRHPRGEKSLNPFTSNKSRTPTAIALSEAPLTKLSEAPLSTLYVPTTPILAPVALRRGD